MRRLSNANDTTIETGIETGVETGIAADIEVGSEEGSLLPFAMAKDPGVALNDIARAQGWTVEADTRLVFDHPELCALREVWRSLCRTERLPARAAFSMRLLKRFLRHVSIFEIVNEDGRRRYRRKLVATVIAERLGGKAGGYLDEFLSPVLYQKGAPYLDAVVDNRCPLRVVAEFILPAVSFLHAEAALLPLADDGKTPDMIMLVAYFGERPNP